jgi:hypothetical protein
MNAMRRNFFRVILPSLAISFILPCQAAEWSVEPRISVKAGYNDNIRLTSADHDSVWETAVTPSIKFGGAEENSGLFGNADVSVRRFFGGSGRESSDVLDREDAHFNVNGYTRTQRNEFTGSLDFTRDSTLDSEFDETGNVIDDRATRIRKTIAPGWSYSLTELMQLNANYSFTKVDFSDDPGIDDNIDYDYHVFSGSLTRQFTPKVQATLASSYSMYKPETNLDSNTLSAQIGIRRSFSETLTTDWLAGMRRTESDTAERIPTGFCVGANPGAKFPACDGGFPVVTGTEVNKDDDSDTGVVYSASITKLLESGKLSFTASRVSTPASDGDLIDTTRFIFNGEHRFTESLRTSLRAEYSTIETIASSTAGLNDRDDRTLYRIVPRVSWRLQREWEIAGSYEYARKDEDNDPKDATRNAVYLTLTYRPDKLYVSR